LVSRITLARALLSQGDTDAAVRELRELVPIVSKVLPREHAYALSARTLLGRALVLQGKAAEAELMLRETYQTSSEAKQLARLPGVAHAWGACLVELGRGEEGVPVLLQADELMRKSSDPDPAQMRLVAEALIKAYERLNDADEANRWRRRLDDLSAPPATRGSS
jgi:lipopolysaccharide biosynthesis regulator YciM